MSPERPPKVLISYSHDSPEHMARVLDLADRLREDGVDADIDQYVLAPEKGWATWMEQQIRDADFILVVCTETYRRRADGKEEFGKGRGVIWECILTYQHLYDAAASNTRFLPVVFEDSHGVFIPTPLQPTSHYCIARKEGYEELYRRLTNQPRVLKPPLGKLKILDSRSSTLSKQPSLEPREHQSSILKFWNLPYNRNPLFTGRGDVLAALRSDLLTSGRQVICGFGGIGKTELAVDIAYRYRDDYTGVLWTSADSIESIRIGFANYPLLSLPQSNDGHHNVVVDAVKQWLNWNNGWLLVLDNADRPELVLDFLPEDQHGHVLITSRGNSFIELRVAHALKISVFDLTEAEEFLMKRTAGKDRYETEGIDDVAAELRYMPLALEQAGAYMSETGTSFRDYLAKLKASIAGKK